MFCVMGYRHIFQWDYGRRLAVLNEECNEVHFANATTPLALVSKVYEEDGKRFANIPNILLQTSGRIRVYAYVETPTSGMTKISSEILVQARKKPTDYVYTETEVLSYKALDDRIKHLEESGTISDEQINAAVEAYLKEHPPSGGVSFETDETLILKDGILSVNTADVVEEDNTLPVTSAAVHTVVGNISAILDTI